MPSIHPLQGTNFHEVLALHRNIRDNLLRAAEEVELTPEQRAIAFRGVALMAEGMEHLTRYRLMLEHQTDEEEAKAPQDFEPRHQGRTAGQAAATVG